MLNKRKVNKENDIVFESLYFFFIESHNYSTYVPKHKIPY